MIDIFGLLQWAFPSGLSLVNIFLLRELWKRNKSRISKDTIDTWHQIANSNNEALANTQKLLAESNEEKLSLKLLLAETNANLKRVERMLDVIAACKFYDSCPVRPELSEYRKINNAKPSGQCEDCRESEDKPFVCPDELDTNKSASSRVDATTQRGVVSRRKRTKSNNTKGRT